MSLKQHLFRSAVGAVVWSALSSGVQAQNAPTSVVDEVVVTGTRLSVRESIRAKRQTDAISDSIAADEVGSIPDFGLGEAVQRLSGVSLIINNGRGEAQFLSVRGFNPDYNAVTVDGVALPSTETTRRTVSLDVVPATFASRVTLLKSAFADRTSEAVGGSTDLRTRSAFDHNSLFISGRANLSDWTNGPRFRDRNPSGQAEFTLSDRFGADRRFGALLQLGYFRRDSSSLNTATDTYGYYAYTSGAQNLPALRQTSATAASATLQPTDSVDGLVAIPDRFRWLTYDNVRQRKSIFGKLEYDDGRGVAAHLTGGSFTHTNSENRYSQFLSRSGNATVNSATTGGFASGSAQVDFDNFEQTRRVSYAQLDGHVPVGEGWRLSAIANRARGSYHQGTVEDVFTQAANTGLAFTYRAEPGPTPLFMPNANSSYFDPARYLESYHMLRDERSRTEVTTLKANLGTNDDDDRDWRFKTGVDYRDLSLNYDLQENRFNRAATAATTLATIGALKQSYQPFNGEGLGMLVIDPLKTAAFFEANPSLFTPATTNVQNSSIGDFHVDERVTAAYATAVRKGPVWSLGLGLRYENLRRTVSSSQPSPLNSTANYVAVDVKQNEGRVFPSAWASYDLTAQTRLKLAASQTQARPRFSDLAQNSSPSVNLTTLTASQSVANPDLKPRLATNLDLSLEHYQGDTLVSIAVFHKTISDEIVRTTSVQTGVSLPGMSGAYTLTTSRAENRDESKVDGVEIGVSIPRFSRGPSLVRDFGVSSNLSLMRMTAPTIRMSDGTFRRTPQMVESAKRAANVTVFYAKGPFGANLSYNYTGKIPISFATDNAVNDLYYKASTTVDAQLRYRPVRAVTVLVQAKNLTNTRPTRVIGPSQTLSKEQLDNGRAYYLGVNFDF